MMFRDREDGGRQLAAKLEAAGLERPFVLGLARGGVPVAFEVARALGADLDVLVVRKLGAPGFPEYALGAIAERGAAYLNPEALAEVGLGEDELDALVDREAEELARRVSAYRRGRPPPHLAGKTAVLVDDGVATGATARAAARAARSLGAKRVVLAAPVIAASTAVELRSDFDDVVAVALPESFFAVGFWYEGGGAEGAGGGMMGTGAPPPTRPPPTPRSTTTSGLERTSARASARSAPATAASGSTISREGATMTTRTPTLAAFCAMVSAAPQVPSGADGRSRTMTCGATTRAIASTSCGPGRQWTANPALSRWR